MSFTKKLMSALVASSLVLGMVSTAFAAPSADEVNTAYTRLNTYGIAQGIPGPDGVVTPGLEQPITRAQLLTLLVRAWGQEANAKLLSGATTGFSDVDGVAGVEWTTGYVFIGNRIAETNGGQKLGTSATTFAPSESLTAIQTLAFTMKFLGLQVGTGDNWVADTVKAAKDAGLITDADEAKYLANPNNAVNRGEAFALLDNLFASYNKLPGGKTIYTTYVDTAAPELTVNKPELTTDKASVTVTGSVKGDAVGVFLGSEMVPLNADGTFSAEIALQVGANDIVFTAVDMVGNTDEESFSVTRNPGVAASITATVAGEVVAGETVDVTVTVADANGVALEVAAADITATVGGSVGTYADGKFTAAEKVGTGTLTFSYGDLTPATVDVKVVAGPLAQVLVSEPSVAKGATVTLTPADKFGNAIASGVTYTWEGTGIAVTSGGMVYTSAPGVYKVTATSGETKAEASIGVYGSVTNMKVEVPETIVANGETRKVVKVTALDEFGNAVTGYSQDDAEYKIALESAGVTFYEDEDDDEGSLESMDLYFEDGVATAEFSVPYALAGETLVFTATHQPNVTDADAVEVEATTDAVLPVATALEIDSIPTYLAANAPKTATIDVIVVDQEGVEIDESYDITATVTGPAALVDDEVGYNGADSVATFTLDNAKSVGVEGTIAVTFTSEGIGSVTGEIKHVIAGNPAKLAVTTDVDSSSVDDEIEVTVEVQDRNGVPVSFEDPYNNAIVVTLSGDGPDYTIEYDVDGDDDLDDVWVEGDEEAVFNLPANESSVTFILSTVDKFTGNVTIDASWDTNADAFELGFGKITGSKVVAFTPGAVDRLAFTSGLILVPVAGPQATFVVNLADQFGNTVTKSGVELAVYTDDSTVTVNGVKTSDEKPLKVTTDANGQAKIEVKARPYADEEYTITVKETADDATSDPVDAILSVEETVVASISTTLYKEVVDEDGPTGSFIKATSAKAGEVVYVVASVKDNYGGEYDFGADLADLAGIADDVLLLEYDYDPDAMEDVDDTRVDAFSFQEADFYADLAADRGYDADTIGVYVAKVTVGKAGVTTLGAEYSKTETELSKTSSIKINANSVASVVVNGGEDIEVDDAGKVYGSYTISLSDAYGNTVSLGKNATLTFLPVDPDLITFRKTEGGATTDTFTTRSTTSFYFVALEDDYEYDVTVEVDLDGDGDAEHLGAFTIVVGTPD